MQISSAIYGSDVKSAIQIPRDTLLQRHKDHKKKLYEYEKPLQRR